MAAVNLTASEKATLVLALQELEHRYSQHIETVMASGTTSAAIVSLTLDSIQPLLDDAVKLRKRLEDR